MKTESSIILSEDEVLKDWAESSLYKHVL